MKIKRTIYNKPPEQFKTNKFTYNLLKSTATTGLYEIKNKDNKLYGYDVIKLIKCGEGYRLPSNAHFGNYGWSFMYLDTALKCYYSLKV